MQTLRARHTSNRLEYTIPSFIGVRRQSLILLASLLWALLLQAPPWALAIPSDPAKPSASHLHPGTPKKSVPSGTAARGGKCPDVSEWNFGNILSEILTGGAEVNFTLSTPEMDTPLERTAASGVHETLLTDNLMTALAAYDDTGTLIRSTEYTAYGAIRSGADPGIIGFAGARRDPRTGLLYLRNRWLSPDLARFLSRDPVGFQGGLDLYGYANHDPVDARDPTGLIPPLGEIPQRPPGYGPPPNDPELQAARAALVAAAAAAVAAFVAEPALALAFQVARAKANAAILRASVYLANRFPWLIPLCYGAGEGAGPATDAVAPPTVTTAVHITRGLNAWIRGLNIHGEYGLEGFVFTVRIRLIEFAPGSRFPLGPLRTLMETLVTRAREAGGQTLRIIGETIVPEGPFSDPRFYSLMQRLGFAVNVNRQAGTLELTKRL